MLDFSISMEYLDLWKNTLGLWKYIKLIKLGGGGGGQEVVIHTHSVRVQRTMQEGISSYISKSLLNASILTGHGNSTI